MPIAVQVSTKPKMNLLKLAGFKLKLRRTMKVQMGLMGKFLKRKIRANLRETWASAGRSGGKYMVSEGILHKRSGRLWKSINYDVSGQTLNTMKTAVGTLKDNPPYARIHEMGGTIRVTEKMRKNAFFIPGVGFRRLKSTTTKIHIPKRSYAWSVVEKNRPRIRRYIRAAVRKAKQ